MCDAPKNIVVHIWHSSLTTVLGEDAAEWADEIVQCY